MVNTIVIKNVKKAFGRGKNRVEALKNVSFSVKKGEIFGLLGPNGAGKSTLISILAGLLTFDEGKIMILGKDPAEVKEQMNVAAAFSNLSGILSIEENLMVYAGLYGVKNPRAKIEDLLKKFDIWTIRKKIVHNLSSGQSTRVNLCKGLINDPKILLLDEATVGLDPDISRKTRDIIKKLRDEHGTTIIFTSHNMAEVEDMCDRIAFLHNGEILEIDTADQLKKLVGRQIIRLDIVPTKKSLKEFIKKHKLNALSVSRYHAELIVTYGQQEIHRVLHPLLEEGFEIRDLVIEKPSLDEVFIKIAKMGDEK